MKNKTLKRKTAEPLDVKVPTPSAKDREKLARLCARYRRMADASAEVTDRIGGTQPDEPPYSGGGD